MPDQDIVEFLLDRIKCLENRFETRFDRLETQLGRWMEKNGDQNVSIEKNADRIETLHKIIDRKNKRFLTSLWKRLERNFAQAFCPKSLTISVATASCIATLLSAFIQILVKYAF